MPSFGQVQLPDYTRTNALFDLASIDKDVNAVQQGRIANQAGQQDLTDRASLRALAPGLAGGDMGAMSQAATLGPLGTGALTGIDAAQTSRRANLSAYGSMAANLAGSIAALPADQQAQAYDIGRTQLLASGMPENMLPPQHPGTAGLLALRNAQVPAAEQVKLNADYTRFDGGITGPLGSPVGGGNLPAGPPHPASGQTLMPGQSLFSGPMPISADSDTQNLVGQTASTLGLNPEWAMRTHYAESGANRSPYGPGSTSRAGALGPMQLMPATAADLQVDPANLSQNIRGGVQYLAQLKQQFGSPVLASAAYNAGPGAVSDFLAGRRSGLPAETVKYVGRVFGADGASLLNAALSGAHGHQIIGAGPGGVPQIPNTPGAPDADLQGPQLASPAGTPATPQTGTDAGAGAPRGEPTDAASLTLNGAMNTLRMRQTDPDGTLPANGEPPQNALLNLGSGGRLLAPSQPNALLGAVTPGPAQNQLAAVGRQPGPPPPSPATAPPGAPPPTNGLPPAPPGMVMGTQRGLPIELKGQPGMTLGLNPATGRVEAMPIPGAVNTGRLAPVKNPDGGTTLYSPSGQPVVTSGPNNRDVETQMYREDRVLAQQQSEAAMMAQQQQGKLLEARQVLAGLPTGANGEARAAWANYAETYMSPQFASLFKDRLGLPDAVPAQEFGKLMTQSAGQQERAVSGARGGIQMMQLFKSANPGLEMQPNANRDILNMQLVASQADQDYAKGHIAWVNQHGGEFMGGGHYSPASNFDQQWIAGRNPQVYLAATNAMNGKPVETWAKGLQPDEVARVRGIIAQIDPSSTVMGPGGRAFRVTPSRPATSSTGGY